MAAEFEEEDFVDRICGKEVAVGDDAMAFSHKGCCKAFRFAGNRRRPDRSGQ